MNTRTRRYLKHGNMISGQEVHERNQKDFYRHLKMHPSAHRAASAFAKKLCAKDPTAVTALKELSARASSDESAANALRIIAVTMKYECNGDSILAGGLPAIASAGGKIIKLALSPAAWAISTSGKVFHWAGSQLQHVSHII